MRSQRLVATCCQVATPLLMLMHDGAACQESFRPRDASVDKVYHHSYGRLCRHYQTVESLHADCRSSSGRQRRKQKVDCSPAEVCVVLRGKELKGASYKRSGSSARVCSSVQRLTYTQLLIYERSAQLRRSERVFPQRSGSAGGSESRSMKENPRQLAGWSGGDAHKFLSV